VLACALLLAMPAGASAKLFLELPGIPGESQVVGFENQIELNSFQFGVGNAVGKAAAGPKMAGEAAFSEIVVTKSLDKATPELMLRVANGAPIPSARLRLTRSSQAGESVVLRYCFTQVRFTSFSQSSGGDLPSESLAFQYATIVQSYTQQNAGGGAGNVFTSGWNVLENFEIKDACDN
jgi:type VI secretion system secreted protein Hcp